MGIAERDREPAARQRHVAAAHRRRDGDVAEVEWSRQRERLAIDARVDRGRVVTENAEHGLVKSSRVVLVAHVAQGLEGAAGCNFNPDPAEARLEREDWKAEDLAVTRVDDDLESDPLRIGDSAIEP